MKLICPFCDHPVSTEDEFVESIQCGNCEKIIDAASIIDDHTMSETALGAGDIDEDDPDFEEPEKGDLIGRFQIVEKIGQGGFGSVFRAHDLELTRDVAIKLPRLDRLSLRHAQELLREAQTAAKLRDANIVSVYEIGRYRQFLYIVSDFVSGPSLSAFIKQVQLTHQEAATLFAQMARGLHKAHEAGVVHRDMKPGNVLMDADAGPMITDFGLARRLGDSDRREQGIMGTPSYMSPEQAMAKSETADCRADVFSVGVMLYQIITGQLPFRGVDSKDVIRAVIEERPAAPREIDPTIPRPLEAICLKALEKDPADRFDTALELAEDLERFRDGEPTQTLPESLLQTSTRITKRNWKPTVIGVAIVSLIVAGILGWLKYQQWLDAKQRTIVSVSESGSFVAIAPFGDDGRINEDEIIKLDGTNAGGD